MTEASAGRRLVALMAACAATAGLNVLSAPRASAAPVTITNASMFWNINQEMQTPAFGCNYLSAGVSDGTQSTFKGAEGGVAIVKNGGPHTWADRCTYTAGTLRQGVLWSGGSGTIDPVSGTVSLSFPGKLSMVFYDSLPFTIHNPSVTVDSAGSGNITAPTMTGYSNSQGSGEPNTPLAPVANVRIVDLTGVNSHSTSGFTTTPKYQGVMITNPAGYDPQNRTTAGWGSWPQGWVDYQGQTGLGSYWYTSGLPASDVLKPPNAITISFPAAGYDGKVSAARGVGSDSTYFVMQALADLYNAAPGCNVHPVSFSECAAAPNQFTTPVDYGKIAVSHRSEGGTARRGPTWIALLALGGAVALVTGSRRTRNRRRR